MTDPAPSIAARARARPRHNLAGALAAAGLTLLFCLLLLAHDHLIFWNDDYEISILPVCADMARAWSHGEFPLLTPYSWVCGNLAGEFQYGVFSVFMNALIVAVWQFPLFFSQQAAALSIAHLMVLAAGAFILARGRNLSNPNSLLVAMVAALNGWIICWGATDWLGALGAFAWLPWAWWGAERALDPARSRWRFLWPAPFVYLLITGGFPYTVLMLALVLLWLGIRSLVAARRLTILMPLLLGVALGVGLAAPAWLALLAYVQGSARATQDPAAHYQWVVPWNAWPALVLPAWTVNWPDFSSRLASHTGAELACGLVPPAALLAAFIANARATWKRIGWDFVLLLLVFIAAMLPTAGMFRWSFRWLPLFHLIMALGAAEALELSWSDGRARARKTFIGHFFSRALQPVGIALALILATTISARIFHFGGPYQNPLSSILIFLVLTWLGLDCFQSRALRQWAPVAVVLAALLATYLCIPPNCGVPKYPFSQALLNVSPLDRNRLYLSLYPPPENAYRTPARSDSVGQTVRPGSTPLWAGLHFINGYSPIRPAGVAREFATSIHGEIDPSMGQWLLGNEASTGHLLAEIGIDGVIVASEYPYVPRPTNEWQLFANTSEGRVFHRRGPPLLAVRQVNLPAPQETIAVSDIVQSRNTVKVSVAAGSQPTSLSFSRPFFPGYRADLNGRELTVRSLRGLIPLVEVPAHARGTLTLTYRPAWLIYGSAIAIACAVAWIVCLVFAWRQRSKASASAALV
ncbi:MAG: hypothetical protein ABI839_00800 [Verrucomicrobiota bacterium]